MSNESILLCAVEQSLLEERELMPPNKRDGWELTAAGTSTPTLSEEIKDFWKSNRIQLKKRCFLVEFSIDIVSTQQAL